jgi:hypothetical protein
MAAASGTANLPADDGLVCSDTGSLAPSTVDFACAAVSLAAASWPLLSVGCGVAGSGGLA